jgi:hypothetical protein
MANVITGDTTKGIKGIGELALRISRYDSYRLFTLYENVNDKKVMDVSGDQKHYLVFRSPKKEIRIPEYDPKGFFEVDKVNGCVLFKITKKNAEDILSMKTGGQKIFHIIRVFEEKDEFGKVLNVTDEVEVYNGRWGDDEDFSAYSTENKVDLLTKALAAQIDKNAKLLNEYNELLEKYNLEVNKISELEKELEELRAERDSLQTQLNEFMGSTYDGTLLSTDTKYIAFENTLDNVSFTEEQFNSAMNDLMTKGEIDLSGMDLDTPRVELEVKVFDNIKGLMINVYQNNVSVGSAVYNQSFYETVEISDKDVFKFECVGMSAQKSKTLYLQYETVNGRPELVKNTPSSVVVKPNTKTTISGTIDFNVVRKIFIFCHVCGNKRQFSGSKQIK